MAYPQPPQTPPQVALTPPTPPKRPSLLKRPLPMWVALVSGLAGIALGAASGGTDKAPAASAPAPTVTVEAPAPTVTVTVEAPAVEAAQSEAPAPEAAPAQEGLRTEVGDGKWTVGRDIAPGTWRTTAEITESMFGCYYEVSTGNNFSDIVENEFIKGGFGTVTLEEGQFFETSGCGKWGLEN